MQRYTKNLKGNARSRETYRAFRRNSERSRAWLLCKLEREERGETRSEFDRRREAERRARLD